VHSCIDLLLHERACSHTMSSFLPSLYLPVMMKSAVTLKQGLAFSGHVKMGEGADMNRRRGRSQNDCGHLFCQDSGRFRGSLPQAYQATTRPLFWSRSMTAPLPIMDGVHCVSCALPDEVLADKSSGSDHSLASWLMLIVSEMRRGIQGWKF